jgi:hypothetical protein
MPCDCLHPLRACRSLVRAFRAHRHPLSPPQGGHPRPADITRDYAKCRCTRHLVVSLRSPRNPSLCQRAGGACGTAKGVRLRRTLPSVLRVARTSLCALLRPRLALRAGACSRFGQATGARGRQEGRTRDRIPHVPAPRARPAPVSVRRNGHRRGAAPTPRPARPSSLVTGSGPEPTTDPG